MGLSNSEINGILRRIKMAKKATRDDEMFFSVFNELITSMCQYTKAAYDHMAMNRAQMAENANSQQEYIQKVEEIDKRRKDKHTKFLQDAILSCRVCDLLGIERIVDIIPDEYIPVNSKLSVDDKVNQSPELRAFRHLAADWCFDFVVGCDVSLDINIDRNSLSGANEIARNFSAEKAKKYIDDLTDEI